MAETTTLPEVKTEAAFKPGELFRALGSLRLTVFLFSLSMILVFVGTLAQKDASIPTAVEEYFHSALVWVPLNLFVVLGRVFLGFPPEWHIPTAIGFPFPGGLTLGFLLLVNLTAAHLTRFRLSWSRAGILIAHLGILLLLIGEMITAFYQVEANMSIASGETANYTDAIYECELAFVVPGESTDKEITISQSLLRRGGRISDPRLPVDVEVEQYAKNSALRDGRQDPDAVRGSDGNDYGIELRIKESSGVEAGSSIDLPAVRLRFLKKDSGQPIGAGTFSLWHYHNIARRMEKPLFFPPRVLTVGGQDYQVSLRPRREYRPYTLRLLEFKHEVYMGTQTPKNYSSHVRLIDPERGVDREALISMNDPLRYRGEAFFQSNFFPDDKGTVLQVVRNPGWLLPYVACTLVTLGLSAHFLNTLAGFLRRRAAA